ncbi:MAG TPA: NUDIX hydrolase [Nitrososphaerales archaeon]|nr:NUDIX hydrolase [Nitrososphaerales archaeon]HUK79243.1 NUDIX hydrolase [Nitrososphaerales archaeon]
MGHKIQPNEFRENVLSSSMLYRGRAVKLRVDRIRLPSGRETSREIIEHPGSVGILPLLSGNRVLLIRQYRLAVGGTIWEIPAGTMESGETATQCARRELEEETGYRAKSLKLLFECYAAPGYSMELMRVFLARGLQLTKQRPEEDEIISVEPVDSESTFSMIRSGKIRDAKTICALAYYRALAKR